MDYLSLPRMAATAEVGWTDKTLRDYGDFSKRMRTQYNRYLLLGYHFRVPTPELLINTSRVGVLGISNLPTIHGSTVRYTTDGSPPSEKSKTLTKNTMIRKGAVFKAATFIPHAGKRSLTLTHQTK